MSEYYSGKRTRNLYQPGGREPCKVSRTKLELFLKCPRCFYLDLVKGVGQPPGYPFSLNAAVDLLLKKEFDLHRSQKTRHPLMESYGIKAIPFTHQDLEKWRHNFTGVQYSEPATHLLNYP